MPICFGVDSARHDACLAKRTPEHSKAEVLPSPKVQLDNAPRGKDEGGAEIDDGIAQVRSRMESGEHGGILSP